MSLSVVELKKMGENAKSYNKELELFCKEHNINKNKNREFYFDINGIHYRVSPYVIRVSNTQRRTIVPFECDTNSIVYIKAPKKRLIEIYKLLASGSPIDDEGNPVED